MGILDKDVITRDEAQAAGLVSYFTGKPCKNGHIAERYTNTGICYECKRGQVHRDYVVHKDRVLDESARSRAKNVEAARDRGKKWVAKNKDKVAEIKRNWKIRHREQSRTSGREYQAKRVALPYYRLSSRFSKSVWAFLRGSKCGRKWESLVGYSHQDLYDHLEKQFASDMTWENYGSYWHVDHIVPKVFFANLDLTPDQQLRLAFSLVNLRPCIALGEDGNYSKHSKIDPELALPVLEKLGIDLAQIMKDNNGEINHMLRYPNGYNSGDSVKRVDVNGSGGKSG